MNGKRRFDERSERSPAWPPVKGTRGQRTSPVHPGRKPGRTAMPGHRSGAALSWPTARSASVMECGDLSPLWHAAEPRRPNFLPRRCNERRSPDCPGVAPRQSKAVTSHRTPHAGVSRGSQGIRSLTRADGPTRDTLRKPAVCSTPAATLRPADGAPLRTGRKPMRGDLPLPREVRTHRRNVAA